MVCKGTLGRGKGEAAVATGVGKGEVAGDEGVEGVVCFVTDCELIFGRACGCTRHLREIVSMNVLGAS